MIAVCTKCGAMFETTEEYANEPERFCGSCFAEAQTIGKLDDATRMLKNRIWQQHGLEALRELEKEIEDEK